MSYRDLQTTVIDLEYGQDPNEFWKYLFIIIAIVGYILYFLYCNNQIMEVYYITYSNPFRKDLLLEGIRLDPTDSIEQAIKDFKVLKPHCKIIGIKLEKDTTLYPKPVA